MASYDMIGPLIGTLSEADIIEGTMDGSLVRGYSAYDIAKMHGYGGTEEEWLASLKGAKGDQGDAGISPEASVSKSGNTATITITDATGTTTAQVLDGVKGDPGDKGDTPIMTATRSGTDTTIYADGTEIAVIHDGEKGDPGDDYVLTPADKAEIAGMVIDDEAGEGDTGVTWSADKIEQELASAGTVQDVQVNGTSVVSGGVANVPVADYSGLGLVKPSLDTGIGIATSGANIGRLAINTTTANELKTGTNLYHPVTPSNVSPATFYGLAKAAGDTTQAQSANAVGTYTDNAKASIKAMLGIGGETQTVIVSGTAPVITAVANARYVCGEVTSIDFTPSASGICDVIFTSGGTVAVLTLPSTVMLPDWFDATVLEPDTTYEISIVDGVYGAVMVW